MAQDSGITAYISLGSDLNKQKADRTLDTKEGIVSEKLPELTLDMPDEDIVKLAEKWEKSWNESSAKSEWEKYGEENEKYWLGKHFDTPTGDKDRAMVDNLIFESVETFLPSATRRNPEPVVSLDNAEKDEQGNENPIHTKYVQKVKGRLADLADKNKIRLKLKKVARHWSIFLLGVVKVGWDLNKNMPIARVIRPKKIMLDPEATIDEDGYSGNRIGERRRMSAIKILSIIGEVPDEYNKENGEVIKKGNGEAVKKIKELVKDDLDTEIQFKEWWTTEYTCWILDKVVLWKHRNPHWNYAEEVQQPSVVNDIGEETLGEVVTKQGLNHFETPEMPYLFLSIFNLGDQPMDKTSLIGQNLANQDRINKRNKQIDKNTDRMNGGMVVSMERSGLSKTQAEGVSKSLRKGGVVVIPTGSPREAIDTYQTPSLPSDVFNDLIDTRNRLRDIFGVKGSSQAGLEAEKTVRGKILSHTFDTDRIGGGVTEYLEQLADGIYNWFVQLLYVYDDGFQFVGNAVPPKIVISVKEGSLLPKDTLSLANQALELAQMNKISNLDLFKILEYPNPEELAGNVWLEINAPHLLYRNNALIQEAVMGVQQGMAEQAQAELQGKEKEFQQGLARDQLGAENKLQLEALKAIAKNEGKPAGRSILSAVPTQ